MFWKLSIVISLFTTPSCFYLKHNVSETGFCLHLRVRPTQLGPIGRASRYIRRYIAVRRQEHLAAQLLKGKVFVVFMLGWTYMTPGDVFVQSSCFLPLIWRALLRVRDQRAYILEYCPQPGSADRKRNFLKIYVLFCSDKELSLE
jgi:hypothetical protein